MVILGFDPGGRGSFGWCITEAGGESRIKVRASDVASSAAEALESVLQHVHDPNEIVAAGIDSPLYWVTEGDRKADKQVRLAMKNLGAKDVHGTVQAVNSLRGACLAQGIMVARLLRQEISDVRLSETHPKALLWLLGIAGQQCPVREVGVGHLRKFVEPEDGPLTEHERDAVLGAVAANAMMRTASGWRDLAQDEHNPFVLVEDAEYWMPITGAA